MISSQTFLTSSVLLSMPSLVSWICSAKASTVNFLRHVDGEIVDLAHMAAGRLDVHMESLDIRPFILVVASEVESLVNEKSLNLSLVMGGALPRIRTDPTHLRQNLVNLLGNAIK